MVLLEPAPARTGTRPLTWSIQISMTRSCSSWESVADYAGRARRKAVDSLTDLEFNEFAIGGFINGAVFERRDEGGQGTEKLHGPLLGTELNGTAVTG